MRWWDFDLVTMTNITHSNQSNKDTARPDPCRCFRTRSVGGRCHACQEAITDVAHVALTAKAVYCGRCCPECSAMRSEGSAR